jgi:hypothetical protein
MIFMDENRVRGKCPVLSTASRDFMVTIVLTKESLPKGSEKLLEASNESWSHYVSPAGDHYGYKRKNIKRYV